MDFADVIAPKKLNNIQEAIGFPIMWVDRKIHVTGKHYYGLADALSRIGGTIAVYRSILIVLPLIYFRSTFLKMVTKYFHKNKRTNPDKRSHKVIQ